MALRTHNVPNGRLKNEFGEVDKAVLLGFEGPCDIVLFILGIEISELHGLLSDF
jgi:hypothetical protein